MRPTQLPARVQVKTEHLLKARLTQKHNQPACLYFADPRRCPLAIALRERVTKSWGEPHDVQVLSDYSEIVFPNKETFRADHSQSVEDFIAWQDDNRTGDGPIGCYEFHWYRAGARRRRAKDITELISSK